MRKLVVVMAAAFVVGAGMVWVFAEAQSSFSPALTGQDHAEIQRLYGMYNQGADFRDAELWLSAFSDDAVFVTGPGREIRGKAALRTNREERYQGQTGDNGRRHLNSSFVITPTADGARGRAYWVVNDVSGSEPKAVASGYYEDLFARTPDGWRITSRTLFRDPVGQSAGQ